jgi:hypothetical protein
VDECKVGGSSLCNKGICVNNLGSYDCFCRPGFSGDHCDFDINECLCGPCKNNATCIDKINTFECQCPPGYAGKTCDQDVDECESSPCKNGATCVDEIARLLQLLFILDFPFNFSLLPIILCLVFSLFQFPSTMLLAISRLTRLELLSNRLDSEKSTRIRIQINGL